MPGRWRDPAANTEVCRGADVNEPGGKSLGLVVETQPPGHDIGGDVGQ